MTTSYTTKHGSGSTMYDATVEQNSDKSWTTLRSEESGADHTFQDSCSSGEDYVRFMSSFSPEGLHLSSAFNFADSAVSVDFDSHTGRLTVIAYPQHPQYKSFPQVETEVEPTPHDHPPALGKFIVNDFVYKAPANNG